MTVTDSIRRTINRAGETRYAIAKKTGVDQATLSRFVAGLTGLDGKSIDALAKYFKLELRPTTRARKAR